MRRARFELIEPLDSGTLGEQHRAVEIRTGDKVIFTRLHAHWTRGVPSSEPFLRLVQRMQDLRVPCVAATLAGGIDDEGWWVAAEDVGGEPLSRRIREARPLPAGPIMSLAHRLATGLAVLHDRSLLHGALTPATVRYTGDGRVVLTDHGLLPLLAGAAARYGTLPPGHALRGDPAYMSPQVVADPSRARPEDDVYALGMVLLYAATGVRPYGDLDMLATAARVLRGVPPFDVRLPFRVRRLIGRCLRPPFYRPEAARIATRTGRSRWRRYQRHRTVQEADPPPGRATAGDAAGDDADGTARPMQLDDPMTDHDTAPGPASREPDPAPGAFQVSGGLPALRGPDRRVPAVTIADDAPADARPASDVPAAEDAPDRKPWVFLTDGMIDAPPVLHGGLLLVTSLDGRLYALDANTGRLHWRYEAPDMIESGPAVHDGVVYIGGRDGVLHALDAVDGAPLRTRRVGDMLGSTPAVDADSICVGTGDGELVVLGHDLRVRHRAGAGDIVDSAPALLGCRAYAGTTGGVLTIDRSTGESRVWPVGDAGGCDPAAAGGLVYVGTAAGELLALDAATGAIRWSLGTSGPVVARPAVAAGTVYASSRDGYLYAVTATTGRRRWRVPTGGPVTGGATAVSGALYLGSRDHRLYRIEGATGTVRWRFDTGGWINRCAPTAGDGLVYAGTANGHLHAVEMRTGRGVSVPRQEIDVRLEL